eukprot:4710060-Prymnesium_polylepis.1
MFRDGVLTCFIVSTRLVIKSQILKQEVISVRSFQRFHVEFLPLEAMRKLPDRREDTVSCGH